MPTLSPSPSKAAPKSAPISRTLSLIFSRFFTSTSAPLSGKEGSTLSKITVSAMFSTKEKTFGAERHVLPLPQSTTRLTGFSTENRPERQLTYSSVISTVSTVPTASDCTNSPLAAISPISLLSSSK